MWPCPAAVPGGQRAALPLPALCQPTAGVTAGVTARMGCCLGTPWHQDLALGCTGKVPVGLCCRGGAAGAVAVALVPRDGTLGDTLALSTGPSGSLPAFPGMAPGAPPLGLGCVGSEAARSAREGTGSLGGLVYSQAVGFSLRHLPCPGAPQAEPVGCWHPPRHHSHSSVPVSWRRDMAQGQPLWPRVPQQSRGQKVPRAPSPGARSAALSAGTCLARGWSCFLPTLTKYFGTAEVTESLARLGTTPHPQFQLVP